jgi:hypothetical protein
VVCSFIVFFNFSCSQEMTNSEHCSNLETGLSYLDDILTFVAIIVQRKIFHSCYFYNFINESYMTALLASR